jgi:hypothetical protein
VSFVPGSIDVSGKKTDQSGDDEAEYDDATRTVTMRIGSGANATSGGTIGIEESAIVSFRVKIDPAFTGTLSNQASIRASGASGYPETSTLTAGDVASSASPTTIFVVQCVSNANCAFPTPFCATDRSPSVCLACIDDSGCSTGFACTNDTCQPGCRGTTLNSCPDGSYCSSTDATIGVCDKCLTDDHCMNPTPVCSPSKECAACASDADCTGKAAGEVCVLQGPNAGSCTHCTAANKGACTGATPTCDDATGQCVGCLVDTDCTDASKPRCDTTAHTCAAEIVETPDAGAPNPHDAGTPGAPDAGGTRDAGIVDEATPFADGGSVEPSDVGAAADTGCSCRTIPSNDVGGGAGVFGGLALALGLAMGRRASRRR